MSTPRSCTRAFDAPVVWGVFDDEKRLVEAIRAARRAGHRIFDVYSPYAVHGLEHEAGFRRSRLPRVGFAFGVFAVLLAFGFQYWATAVSWPLEVGNKPWNSWPAFVPVAFELTVLFAGVGTALVFLWSCRLWPGRKPHVPFDGLTDDRFALGLEPRQDADDENEAGRLLEEGGALFTSSATERESPKEGPRHERDAVMKLPTIRWTSLLLPACLLGLTVLLAGLTFGMARDFGQPNVLFLPDMVESVPYDAFDANPVFADGKTLRRPVAGTIARGHMPLRYGAGEGEALRAGRELQNPFDATPAVLARGEQVYASFCRPCHGEGGVGDGPVTTRGFPPPPALQGKNSVEMGDGRIFHLLTFGQGNMPAYAPQISVEDRWKVIHHVRRLQAPNAENGS